MYMLVQDAMSVAAKLFYGNSPKGARFFLEFVIQSKVVKSHTVIVAGSYFVFLKIKKRDEKEGERMCVCTCVRRCVYACVYVCVNGKERRRKRER